MFRWLETMRVCHLCFTHGWEQASFSLKSYPQPEQNWNSRIQNQRGLPFSLLTPYLWFPCMTTSQKLRKHTPRQWPQVQAQKIWAIGIWLSYGCYNKWTQNKRNKTIQTWEVPSKMEPTPHTPAEANITPTVFWHKSSSLPTAAPNNLRGTPSLCLSTRPPHSGQKHLTGFPPALGMGSFSQEWEKNSPPSG